MNSKTETKNWEQIETLFHFALSLDAAQRQAYLVEACGGNDDLRGEVETLISAFEERADFFEQPVFHLGMKILENQAEKSLTGEIIGAYRILRQLGSGGMGDVYLAEDTKLNRQVALKFLSPALVGDKWAKRQLVKEAQAVAMLDHPNICGVHGIEEIGEHNFIVMQYIEGETLSVLIREQRLKPEQALSLARQIADAVAAAHAHGIIHRDIKTGNIMVTPSNQAKVLDFGLAQIVRQQQKPGNLEKNLSRASQNGLIAGTVAYMSPEQLRGENLDYRTDIFSLGTVMYEMFTGGHPFLQESDAETISAILTSQATPINGSVGRALPGITRVVQKCLEKNKEQRYQSVSELLLEFQNLSEKSSPKRRNRLYFRLLTGLFLVALLITLGAFIYQRATKPRVLAVLPFINESADPNADYLCDGMAESLIKKLSDSSKLQVKPFTLVSGYKGDNVDPLAIGSSLNADAVLTGKIVRRNEQQIFETSLINTADGTLLWSEKTILKDSDFPIIQNNISENVITKLQPSINADGGKKSVLRQENPEAYKYYLLGRYYWKKRDKENIQKAIDYFDEALRIDPGYASAHAGLADAYVVRSLVTYQPMPAREASKIAKYSAMQALELDNDLCESHAALGVVLQKYEWNWAAAEREYRRAIELNPEYAQAHYWYSDLLATTGRFDEAISESFVAQKLDPFSPLGDMNVGRVFYYARQYDRAVEHLSNVLKKDPDNSKATFIIGLAYLQQGKQDEALKILERLYNSKDKSLAAATLGFTYGKIGRKPEALKILAEFEAAAKTDYSPPLERAIIYVGLGDKEKALFWLEKSFQDRLTALSAVNAEPLFDDLRPEPQFQEIIRRMNLNSF